MAPLQPQVGFFLNDIELVVRAFRVVMKQDEMLYLSRERQRSGLADQAMSPTVFVGHISFEVLSIVNEDIGLPAKLDERLKRGRLFVRRFELIVGQVDHGVAAVLKPIPCAATWMIGRNFRDVKSLLAQKCHHIVGHALRMGRQVVRDRKSVV